MGAAALAVVAVAATALSTATQISAQSQAGKAQKASANYQASVARNNKILADRAAKDAIERGEVAEANQRLATAQLIGRQRAVLGSSGALVDEGSALGIISDTAGIGELDALTIRSNAEREAANFRAQGRNFEADAILLQSQGRSASAAAQTAQFGTLVGGIGSVASKWYSFSGSGVGSGSSGGSF